jgi:hypothetical protein
MYFNALREGANELLTFCEPGEPPSRGSPVGTVKHALTHTEYL